MTAALPHPTLSCYHRFLSAEAIALAETLESPHCLIEEIDLSNGLLTDRGGTPRHIAEPSKPLSNPLSNPAAAWPAPRSCLLLLDPLAAAPWLLLQPSDRPPPPLPHTARARAAIALLTTLSGAAAATSRVRVLDFSGNHFEGATAKALGQVLTAQAEACRLPPPAAAGEQQRGLRVVRVRANEWWERWTWPLDGEPAAALAEGIRGAGPWVEVLDFSSNRLSVPKEEREALRSSKKRGSSSGGGGGGGDAPAAALLEACGDWLRRHGFAAAEKQARAGAAEARRRAWAEEEAARRSGGKGGGALFGRMVRAVSGLRLSDSAQGGGSGGMKRSSTALPLPNGGGLLRSSASTTVVSPAAAANGAKPSEGDGTPVGRPRRTTTSSGGSTTGAAPPSPPAFGQDAGKAAKPLRLYVDAMRVTAVGAPAAAAPA